MQTATFLTVLVILIIVVYHSNKIKEIMSLLEELVVLMNRVYNLLKP